MSDTRRVRYRLDLEPCPAPPPRAAPARPPLRQVLEPAAVVAGLVGVVLFAPLDSRWFPTAVLILGAGAVGYAVFGLARFDGAAEDWGLVPPPRSDLEVVHGCLGTGILALVSLAPIGVLHLLVARPPMGHPAAYLGWCAVQDFVFFSLFLRNVAGLVTPHPAVALTAVLFGLSHYPLDGFMVATGLVAAAWGYVFLYCRLLWVVTASHFLLGLLVLA